MDQSVEQQNVQPSPPMQQPMQAPSILPASPQPQKPSKNYFKRFFTERLNRRNYLFGSLLTWIFLYPSGFMLIIAPPPPILITVAFIDFFMLIFTVILMARR